MIEHAGSPFHSHGLKRLRFAGIALVAHAIPPILTVWANGALWPWVTRSANIGWAVWVVTIGLILASAIAVSFLVGAMWRGSRLARGTFVVGGLVGHIVLLCLIGRG